jgi:hypothetical protein
MQSEHRRQGLCRQPGRRVASPSGSQLIDAHVPVVLQLFGETLPGDDARQQQGQAGRHLRKRPLGESCPAICGG